MNHLCLTVILLLGVLPINAKEPDVYMREEMEECAKGYRESLIKPPEDNEVFTVKCTSQMVPYIINLLYAQGFRVLNVTFGEPIWVIDYCY